MGDWADDLGRFIRGLIIYAGVLTVLILVLLVALVAALLSGGA